MGAPSPTNKYQALSAAGKAAYQKDAAAEDATRPDFNHPLTAAKLVKGAYDKY